MKSPTKIVQVQRLIISMKPSLITEFWEKTRNKKNKNNHGQKPEQKAKSHKKTQKNRQELFLVRVSNVDVDITSIYIPMCELLWKNGKTYLSMEHVIVKETHRMSSYGQPWKYGLLKMFMIINKSLYNQHKCRGGVSWF